MKIIRVEVVGEIEVPDEFYEGMSDDQIKEAEKHNWQEWILENVKEEKIFVKSA